MTNTIRAGKGAHHVSYNWIRRSRQEYAAKEILTRDALEPRKTSSQVATDSLQAIIFVHFVSLCEFMVLRFFRLGGFFFSPDHCWKIDMSLFPRFTARLSVQSRRQLQQTRGPSAHLDIITGGKFPRLPQKSFFFHGIENQFPLDLFLAWQHERDRLMVAIEEEQKCIIPNRLSLEIQNIDGVAAQEHFQTTH
jgi:hypothetical protein